MIQLITSHTGIQLIIYLQLHQVLVKWLVSNHIGSRIIHLSVAGSVFNHIQSVAWWPDQ